MSNRTLVPNPSAKALKIIPDFSPESQKQSTIARSINDWSASNSIQTSAFLSPCAPSVQWYDHAFQTQCSGHTELADPRRAWHNALPDFAFELEGVTVTLKGAVVQVVGTGTFMDDFVGEERRSGRGLGIRL
jgi:hypothetical protein